MHRLCFLMLHKYPHFNPNKHKVDVKIAVVRSGFHCKHNINYHLVWIPKYRKTVLQGDVKMVLETIIAGQCRDLSLEMLALEVMPDHLHCFVGAKPTHRPCDIVHQLKGNTSIQLRRVFPELKYLGYQTHYKRFPSLWARGYYCGSAGHVSQEAVARYIAEQQGKKDVFEYSIFGHPEVKIGNFTQTKLGGF